MAEKLLISPKLVQAFCDFCREQQVSFEDALRCLLELGLASYEAQKATRLQYLDDAVVRLSDTFQGVADGVRPPSSEDVPTSREPSKS